MRTSRLREALMILFLVSGYVGVAAQTPLEGHGDEVTYVSFLPDGKTLLSGADDSSIRLWDAIGGKPAGVWQQVPKFDPGPSTKVLALSGDGLLQLEPTLMQLARCTPAVMMLPYTDATFSRVSGVSPDTTLVIRVSVCSRSPGLMRSGE